MNNQSSNTSVYDVTIRLLLLIGIIVWCLMIVYPFVSIILWSIILSIALFPLHTKLANKIGEKPKIASIIIVFSILLIFILPSGFIINNLVDEAKDMKLSYDIGTLKIPPPSERVKELPVIGEKLYNFWQSAYHNLEQIFINYKEQIIDIGKRIVTGIFSAAGGLIQLIISLCIAGAILSAGGVNESFRKFFRKAGGENGDEIADITFKTVGSVVKGVIGEALVIALMNGILFTLAGVPYAGLWALLIFIFAVIQLPVFFVSVPVMIYFFAVKDTTTAILWTVGLLLVSLSDNFLTPLMLGKNAPVPMPVIFIGVIGGCVVSGFIGLFTGAIVMSIGYTLLIKWINPAVTEIS